MSPRFVLQLARALSGPAVAMALGASVPAFGQTWTWDGGSGLWSGATNWVSDTIPQGGNSTVLAFPDLPAYTATHDLGANFQISRLLFQSNSNVTVAAVAGSSLRFPASSAAELIHDGSGAVDFGIDLKLDKDVALRLSGSSTSPARLRGTIGRANLAGNNSDGGLTFDSGYWQLNNAANSFEGGVRINAGATVELLAPGGPINLSGASSLLGAATSPITLNGGTLKFTTLGPTLADGTGGSIIFSASTGSKTFVFGTNGGLLDLTLGQQVTPDAHAGTIGSQDVSGGNLAIELRNSAPAVVRFDGGQRGLSSFGYSQTGDWMMNGNTLRIQSITAPAGTPGPLRIELTNGALARAPLGSAVTVVAPMVYRGVAGGDPTSGPIGTENSGTTLQTGRVGFPAGTHIFQNGLTLENALQVGALQGAAGLNGDITIAGTASGNPGYVTFAGRSTNTTYSDIVAPPTLTNFHQVLWLGRDGDDELLVQSGGVAVLDARVRIDQVFHHGVLLDGRAVLEGGGTLRIAQSISNFSRMPGMNSFANVGDIILRGDVEGRGTTAREAVLDLRLPAPNAAGTAANGTPTPIAPYVSGDPLRHFGGLVTDASHEIIIHGAGFGGLRVEANARPDQLFSSTGVVDGPAAPDPVSSLRKIDSYLTAARLSQITGSGGYLTAAPAGQTWSFPVGGEWGGAVPVGLRVANHHAGGVDVSLAQISAFSHNVAVDAGATLDFGPSPFVFGPATATPGVGTLRGKGTVLASGGLTVAAGGRIAPGLNDAGTLTVEQVTLSGTLEVDATGNTADLLTIVGSLVLDASSQLALANGSVPGPRNYKIITAGTRAGSFGSTAGLPATHTLSYTRPGEVWLSFVGGRQMTWMGNSSSAWDKATPPNWEANSAFVDGDRVLFDDSAPPGRRSVAVSGANVSPASVVVNTAGNYTLISSPGAALTGSGELTKSGPGTLTLSGPATFEGGILVQGGTLQTSVANSIPDTGKVVVFAGAQLTLGAVETIQELIVSGNVNASTSLTVDALHLEAGANVQAPLVVQKTVTATGGTFTLPQPVGLGGGMRTLHVGAGAELILGGAVGNGAITKTGAGILALNAANNFAGGLAVREGTVRAGVAGAIPANSNVSIETGAIVSLNGFPHNLGLLDSFGNVDTGGAALNVQRLSGAGGTLFLGAGALAVAQTSASRYDGAITTSGTLSKSGAGSLTLGGANTIGGGTTISAGALRIAGDAGNPGGAITILPGASLVAETTIAAPVILAGGTLGANYGDIAFAGDVIAAASTLSVIQAADPDMPGTPSELVIGGTLRGSGNLSIQAAAGSTSADRGQGVRLRGAAPSDFTGTITVGNTAKFELQSSVAGPFSPAGSGKIVLTAGTLVDSPQSRSGTYSQLNLRNNHAGDTVLGNNVEVSGVGWVNLNPGTDANVAPDGSLIILGNLRMGDGQTVAVNKNSGPVQVVQFNTVTLTGGTATFSPSSLGSGFGGKANLALGPISELSPGSGIAMTGGEELFLLAANTYTGPTRLESGKLWLAAPNALPAMTALQVNGGTLLMQNSIGPGISQTVGSLSGSGGRIENSASDAPADLIVNQSADTVFGGTIDGNVRLIKQGTGTLRVTTQNFPAETVIAAGALSVSSGGAQGEITGAMTVENGATLLGFGTVGALLVRDGGRLEPGEGLGVLTAGSLVMESGSRLTLDLAGTVAGNGHDSVRAVSGVALHGQVELRLNLGFQPAFGDVFSLILNDSVDPVQGGGRLVYAGNALDSGETFFVASGGFEQTFRLDYDEGSNGNDVILTAVPEPGAAVLLLGGLALLARRRRNR